MSSRQGIPDGEIGALRQEVATLATELERLNSLRLIRLFQRYRKARRAWADRRVAGGKANAGAVAAEQANGYDVVFFGCAGWQYRYQRYQHLAQQWADHGHRVFFVEPEFRAPVNGARQQGTPYTARQVLQGVWEVHLAGAPDLRPLQERMLAADADELATACDALARDFEIGAAVSVAQLPFWRSLMGRLRARRHWKIVYDLIDRWYGVLPHAHAMLSEEEALLREADCVVATARLLQEQAAAQGVATVLIPNGAQVEHFASPSKVPAAEALTLKPPVIGYFGNIAPWLDLELIEHTATDRPEWTFLLIGSGAADIGRLRSLPNVRFTGEVPYAELPAYLARFDVCTIPFRLMPVTASTDPVKFYEYLASGKPIVSTDLPELAPYREWFYAADGAAGFARAIERALAEDNDERRAARRAFAERHSWRVRYEAFDRAVRDAMEGKASPGADGPTVVGPAPYVGEISPWGTRNGDVQIIALCLYGRELTPDCVALADEQPLKTEYVSVQELRCELSLPTGTPPGVVMISVLDRGTWRQSNRRVFTVLGV